MFTNCTAKQAFEHLKWVLKTFCSSAEILQPTWANCSITPCRLSRFVNRTSGLYTVFDKKHPLTFSYLSEKMLRYTQKFQ